MTIWKLDIVPGPDKFALVMGDVHLPYFSHIDAREIVQCLEGAGFCNAPFILNYPAIGETCLEEGEYVCFRPDFEGATIQYCNGDDPGRLKVIKEWNLSKDDAWALAEAISSRLARAA